MSDKESTGKVTQKYLSLHIKKKKKKKKQNTWWGKKIGKYSNQLLNERAIVENLLIKHDQFCFSFRFKFLVWGFWFWG